MGSCSPPNPPSPRARSSASWVHSGVPSGVVTVVSDQITAALPLSQMSVNLVTATPVPDGGIGAGADTASLAVSTLLSSMSMPGNFTVGGAVPITELNRTLAGTRFGDCACVMFRACKEENPGQVVATNFAIGRCRDRSMTGWATLPCAGSGWRLSRPDGIAGIWTITSDLTLM